MDEKRRESLTWVWFSLIRLALFAVALLVLLLVLPVPPWLSAVLAAIIAFCLSYLLLDRPRSRMSAQLYRARHGERTEPVEDDAAEDAAVEHRERG